MRAKQAGTAFSSFLRRLSNPLESGQPLLLDQSTDQVATDQVRRNPLESGQRFLLGSNVAYVLNGNIRRNPLESGQRFLPTIGSNIAYIVDGKSQSPRIGSTVPTQDNPRIRPSNWSYVAIPSNRVNGSYGT